MPARTVFVDEQNIDELFGEEDSDVDEETSDSGSSKGEGDRSNEESNSEEESKEGDWVVGATDAQRLNFTGDQGPRVQLPENP